MHRTVPRPRPWGRPDLPERPPPTAARAQQPITSFFERATPEEAAEQAAERMEADAAAAEERKAAQAEAAANAPPKRAPGHPRFAALPLKPLPKPHPDGASNAKADWWQPALILPILREVALRQNFATAVGALAYRFPTIYGALAPTKPLSEVTVRLWFRAPTPSCFGQLRV
jgi:hypothetical protein